MRILQYDPQISAEVYSQRQAAEEGFDSGVATGLARLGRALSEREEGFRRAGAGAMAAREAVSFWDSEVARLDELGAKIPPGKAGFHDLAMKEHLARRTETIARLKETDPEQASLFDLRTRPLVETLERRASAMEAEASGQTLAAGMGGALTIAAKTVRADPLQHDALHGQLAETLSEMERDGVDADALAGVRASADRSLATAAIGGLIDDGQFDDARELLADGRMPTLTPEDRREQERLVGRAERRAEATGSAELAAARDTYWAGYRSLEARLREGGEAPDLRYTDESIRAALPEEQAEKMILLRDTAEDAGDAYGRGALASRDTIDTLIAGAGPEEARHLRAAAQERERRLAEDPAGFVLGNARVKAAEDAWLTALAGDDPNAIVQTARAYARASLDEQSRLGVAEADRRVLPAGSAAAMVTAFTGDERPDPAGLGAELRERFGEHWRPVLKELKTAGLPEGMAAIAAMDRPDQQAAAQKLSALVGTSTAELKGRIDDADVEAVDRTLRAVAPELGSPGETETEGGSQAALIQRRAFDLIAAGEAPVSAAITAAAEMLTTSPAETAVFKRSAPQRMAAAPKPPADQQSPNVIDAALPPASEVERSLAMSEEIKVLAERLGLDPEFLPPDSEGLRNLLRDLDGFEGLSPDHQERVGANIRNFQDSPPQFWIPLQVIHREARIAARQASEEPAEPAENALLLENQLQELRIGPVERRERVSRQKALELGPQWWSTLSEDIRKANFAWVNEALVNGDELEREFAVKALLEADRQSLDIRQILSEESIRSYVDFWRSSYERGSAIDISRLESTNGRFGELVKIGLTNHNLPISDQVYQDILARVSQVPYATREERTELVRYIATVVTPFSEIHGMNLQRAVGALSVGRDDESNKPMLIDIPGPYVEFLTNRDLAFYFRARDLERLHLKQEPHPPDSFWEYVGLIDGAGAVLGVGSAIAAPGVGSVVGASLSILGIGNAVDEHEKALGDYYAAREVYWRFRNPAIREEMNLFLNRAFSDREPSDPEENVSGSVTGNTSLQ